MANHMLLASCCCQPCIELIAVATTTARNPLQEVRNGLEAQIANHPHGGVPTVGLNMYWSFEDDMRNVDHNDLYGDLLFHVGANEDWYTDFGWTIDSDWRWISSNSPTLGQMWYAMCDTSYDPNGLRRGVASCVRTHGRIIQSPTTVNPKRIYHIIIQRNETTTWPQFNEVTVDLISPIGRPPIQIFGPDSVFGLDGVMTEYGDYAQGVSFRICPDELPRIVRPTFVRVYSQPEGRYLNYNATPSSTWSIQLKHIKPGLTVPIDLYAAANPCRGPGDTILYRDDVKELGDAYFTLPAAGSFDWVWADAVDGLPCQSDVH